MVTSKMYGIFFPKTKNIEKIMPKKLKFKNTSGRSSKFYEGKIVGFKFKLFKFIPINIQSEIKKISHNRYFILTIKSMVHINFGIMNIIFIKMTIKQ